RRPQHLVIDVGVGEALHLVQEGQRLGGFRRRRGDELQQRLGIVRGDVRMRQRRTEAFRMRRERQAAVRIDTQAFLLEPLQPAVEQASAAGPAEGIDSRGVGVFQACDSGSGNEGRDYAGEMYGLEQSRAKGVRQRGEEKKRLRSPPFLRFFTSYRGTRL